MKKTTAQMARYYELYNRSEKCFLTDCYANFSEEKSVAFKNCIDMAVRLGGYRVRMLTHNVFQFTVGFEYYENNEKMFAVITKTGIYTIPVCKISVNLEKKIFVKFQKKTLDKIAKICYNKYRKKKTKPY